MRHEGFRGFYRGFGTSLMGTIPARALYMTALEVTKSNVGTVTSCSNSSSNVKNSIPSVSSYSYTYINGLDAFRKIMYSDGFRGLYRGFGISILTYALSNAVWWASYSVAHRPNWGGFGCYMGKKKKEENDLILIHGCNTQ
ncbi:uncharacterized protein LOC133038142 [Cannabis sativa]|uniref:Mitochondrial carrier protein n=1 Tax=Cannabis sativa TaxID=3483 RepID=A0A7J6EDG2_CANSA|nr:uncharacterized protein LOC133038142 [Cannabis sativa]KAF4356483.1 hypothetical protein F8388_026955 [Cannabis sativa]KAF4356486.1 hypothetical protein F8388_026958 [Cannabis sativa]